MYVTGFARPYERLVDSLEEETDGFTNSVLHRNDARHAVYVGDWLSKTRVFLFVTRIHRCMNDLAVDNFLPCFDVGTLRLN